VSTLGDYRPRCDQVLPFGEQVVADAQR